MNREYIIQELYETRMPHFVLDDGTLVQQVATVFLDTANRIVSEVRPTSMAPEALLLFQQYHRQFLQLSFYKVYQTQVTTTVHLPSYLFNHWFATEPQEIYQRKMLYASRLFEEDLSNLMGELSIS